MPLTTALTRILSDRVTQTLILTTTLVCAWFAYENSVAALEISKAALCHIEDQTLCEDLGAVIRDRAILPHTGPF